jgi:hypothetical protein
MIQFMAAYSKRALVDKLGIKEGFRIALVDAPRNYGATLGRLPKNAAVLKIAGKPSSQADFIQVFSEARQDLETKFPALKPWLSPQGMLWVSWPKGASKVKTDLNENIVREIGVKNGLVDIKVCAVDETWSGLKFVYRLKDRP